MHQLRRDIDGERGLAGGNLVGARDQVNRVVLAEAHDEITALVADLEIEIGHAAAECCDADMALPTG